MVFTQPVLDKASAGVRTVLNDVRNLGTQPDTAIVLRVQLRSDEFRSQTFRSLALTTLVGSLVGLGHGQGYLFGFFGCAGFFGVRSKLILPLGPVWFCTRFSRDLAHAASFSMKYESDVE